MRRKISEGASIENGVFPSLEEWLGSEIFSELKAALFDREVIGIQVR